MFDQVLDLPLHPLIVHAAVFLIPLSGVLGILFVIPRTRAWSRLPLLLVSLLAAAVAYVAAESGEALLAVISATASPEELIAATEHQVHGDRLMWFTFAYAAVAVLAYLLSMPRRSVYRGVVGVVMSVLLVVGAGALMYQSVLAGHSGAVAVWNPDGSVDYRAPF